MITTSTGEDFWLDRLMQAVESALAAPSERSREAYLELAHHYRSMHALVSKPSASGIGRSAADPGQPLQRPGNAGRGIANGFLLRAA